MKITPEEKLNYNTSRMSRNTDILILNDQEATLDSSEKFLRKSTLKFYEKMKETSEERQTNWEKEKLEQEKRSNSMMDRKNQIIMNI